MSFLLLPTYLITLNIMLALFASTILRKAWMRYVALGCAALQTVALLWLLIVFGIDDGPL